MGNLPEGINPSTHLLSRRGGSDTTVCACGWICTEYGKRRLDYDSSHCTYDMTEALEKVMAEADRHFKWHLHELFRKQRQQYVHSD